MISIADLPDEPALLSYVIGAAMIIDLPERQSLLAAADALSRLTKPTPLLTAPAGLFGQPPGLLPAELVAAWQERVPALRPQTVPDTNHYTIMFEREAAAVVSQAIRAAAL